MPSDSAPPGMRRLRAKFVVPIEGPPIAQGEVLLRNGRLEYVGRRTSEVAEDAGDVALLPALVNAHTHLEFSHLAEPLGTPGMSLVDWIGEVIRCRRTLLEAGGRAAAIAQGIREAAAATALVGEIATVPWEPDWYLAEPPVPTAVHDAGGQAPPLQGVVFQELLGLRAERQSELYALAQSHLGQSHLGPGARADVRRPRWDTGLSPHAPYTFPLSSLGDLVALATRHRCPVAMHLAESPEELELLASGGGPFRDLLESVGAWEPGAVPFPCAVSDYLHVLLEAPAALVIHGNYLQPADWELIANRRQSATVVYCPRTHARFAHSQYPAAAMLARGVRLALGTDSRASNPDLDMLAEVRFAAVRHPQVAPDRWLEIATLAGAEALGREADLGSLRAGKRACMIAVPLPQDLPVTAANVAEHLLGSDLPAVRLA